MKRYLKEYIKVIEEKLEKQQTWSSEERADLIEKIQFFQHERLIHLLVTIAFAFFTICFMALGMLSSLFLIIFAILIVFDLFYIYHYFFLENAVQYLYKLYDKVKEKL